MPTKTVTVRLDVPEGTSEAAKASAEQQALQSAVLTLWQRGDLTTRGAARELGLNYHTFLDLLAAKGIPVESRPPDLNAIAAARRKLAEGRA